MFHTWEMRCSVCIQLRIQCEILDFTHDQSCLNLDQLIDSVTISDCVKMRTIAQATAIDVQFARLMLELHEKTHLGAASTDVVGNRTEYRKQPGLSNREVLGCEYVTCKPVPAGTVYNFWQSIQRRARGYSACVAAVGAFDPSLCQFVPN